MSAKTRIKQLEAARTAGKPERWAVMVSAQEDGGLANFDGVEMPQAEADKLAAALPNGVGLILIVYTEEGE